MIDKDTAKRQPKKSDDPSLDIVPRRPLVTANPAPPASALPSSLSPADILALQPMVGNQAVQRMLAEEEQHPTATSASRPAIQAKRTVNEPGDSDEQEAEQIAQEAVAQIHAAPAQPTAQRMPAAYHDGAVTQPTSGHNPSPPEEVRTAMQDAFGVDLGDVRLHADAAADELSRSLHARAFTAGRDIYFRQGEYASHTADGQKLLAHELAHVLQQRGNAGAPVVQRQEIPSELQTSVNYRAMSVEDLQYRYDLISQTLLLFNQSTPETARLEAEAGQIGAEIGRRRAMAAGRTFTPEAIERMRVSFVDNARSASPLSCIACMNQGLRLLLGDQSQAVGSEVQTTMAKLQQSSRAGAAQVIEFNDSRGRMTTGVRRPETLSGSIWDALLALAGNDVGWSVFGLSLMDGYHSVTLTLDNNDSSAPRVYWSDQWSSRGGWQEFSRASLDAEITRLIQQWWDKKPEGNKPRTRVTLWRLHQ